MVNPVNPGAIIPVTVSRLSVADFVFACCMYGVFRVHAKANVNEKDVRANVDSQFSRVTLVLMQNYGDASVIVSVVHDM